jgi:hypothetical protein
MSSRRQFFSLAGHAAALAMFPPAIRRALGQFPRPRAPVRSRTSNTLSSRSIVREFDIVWYHPFGDFERSAVASVVIQYPIRQQMSFNRT